MKHILIVLLLIAFSFISNAQESFTAMTPEELTNMQLPPLDVLFENANNSAAVDFYRVRMEEEASLLKTEKRSWLKYFRAQSTFQYGLMGINSSFSDNDTPLFYQYSGARQAWYNVGVSVAIPFDDFFDRKNRIKRQQLKTKATEVEIEKWHDEQKLRIIEMYTKAQKELAVLKIKAESVTMANAQYQAAEQDFLNGKIEIDELNQRKSIESDALETYENTKAELNKALLQLEILSKTKIIK
ncbi:TolC family protein [Massilibacteroides sp.]|uniref:TolC family protein n=1 Tax=Massilibacteroides sp. TaxID=2034766 RepID=UPI002626044D|nr:TolC family protein [Massilibacteroides sp.]MDD4514740.1 TolC family protein [Massilibacteroides sp.]